MAIRPLKLGPAHRARVITFLTVSAPITTATPNGHPLHFRISLPNTTRATTKVWAITIIITNTTNSSARPLVVMHLLIPQYCLT
jgi:hypothetical protein